MAENLNLTPDQQAKVQPIIDQAKPQIEGIRREAMEKTKAVMDNAMAQIRPLLTPEQQKQLEAASNDRRGGGEGREVGGGQVVRETRIKATRATQETSSRFLHETGKSSGGLPEDGPPFFFVRGR